MKPRYVNASRSSTAMTEPRLIPCVLCGLDECFCCSEGVEEDDIEFLKADFYDKGKD